MATTINRSEFSIRPCCLDSTGTKGHPSNIDAAVMRFGSQESGTAWLEEAVAYRAALEE
jgi:hypothetical protein